MSLERALKKSLKNNNSKINFLFDETVQNYPQHIKLGIYGENFSVSYLMKKGYKILDRNKNYRIGEIDIVTHDGEEIVFVEVRTRRIGKLVPASSTVGPSKLKKLIKACRIWVETHSYEGFWRIDLVTVTLNEKNIPTVEHIKDITEGIE